MLAKACCLGILTVMTCRAQGPAFQETRAVSAKVAALRQAIASSDPEAGTRFWAEVHETSTPLVEPLPGSEKRYLVTFLFRGDDMTRNVVMYAGPALFEAEGKMFHIEGSDVWFRSWDIRGDARFTYFLSPNDTLEPFDSKHGEGQAQHLANLRLDPLNSCRARGTFTNEVSCVELPGAPPQLWHRPAGASKGTLNKTTFHSDRLKNDRILWVYTPAEFSSGSRLFPVLILFDSKDYLPYVAPTLDNLIAAKQVPPMLAVLVDDPSPGGRVVELACSSEFAGFLAEELMPWLVSNYSAVREPSGRIISGSSFGGLAAVCAGMERPDVFGRVLSQSGSFWWTPANDLEPEWLSRRFAAMPKLPLNFFLDVGQMELDPSPAGPTQLEVNRHFRDVLTARGYALTYREFNGGHEGINWRGGLADGLRALMRGWPAAQAR